MRLVYVTYKNADMTEGRDPMVAVNAFSAKKDAEAFIDVQPGCMGRTHRWSQRSDWAVRPMAVYDSLEEAVQGEQDEIRKNALNKLTEQEKKALGFL